MDILTEKTGISAKWQAFWLPYNTPPASYSSSFHGAPLDLLLYWADLSGMPYRVFLLTRKSSWASLFNGRQYHDLYDGDLEPFS